MQTPALRKKSQFVPEDDACTLDERRDRITGCGGWRIKS